MFHATLSPGGIHSPFNFIWANTTERNAQVVTADDIYKLGLQEDTQIAYILLDLTPTWQAIVTTGASISLNDLADVDVTGVTDGQVLTYDNGSGDWIPSTISTNDHLVSDAVTNALSNAVTLQHQTSSTPTTNFGTSILFQADSSTTDDQDIGEIGWNWSDATHATRRSKLVLIGYNNTGSGEIGVIESPSTAFVAGSTRGIGAVDLQGTRVSSNQIAGGNFSGILSGRENRIDSDSHFSLINSGDDNIVINSEKAIILGGVENEIGDSTYEMPYSFIGNGTQNSIKDTMVGSGNRGYNTILNGVLNSIKNYQHSTILSGADSSVNADSSCIISGQNVRTTWESQIASGITTSTGGNSKAQGTIQGVCYEEVTHSSNSWYRISSTSGTQDYINIPTDDVITFDILIIGTTVGAGSNWSFKIEGAAKNDGGTVSVLASTVTNIFRSNISFSAKVDVENGVGKGLTIEVSDSSISGDTVRWTSTIRTADVRAS